MKKIHVYFSYHTHESFDDRLSKAVSFALDADDNGKDVDRIDIELPSGETCSLDFTLGGEFVLDTETISDEDED